MLVSLLLVLFGFAARPALAQPLELARALQEAQSSHEQARIARLAEEQAEAEVERARSDFYPTLSAGVSATLRAQARQDRYHSAQGDVTLAQPLFRPSTLPILWSAEHRRQAAAHSAKDTERTLALDTAQAFFDVLAAERVLDAAKRRLDRARENFATSEARAEAELSSSNDVTRARLDLTSARREVVARTAELEQRRLGLGLLVGHPVDGPLAAPTATLARAESAPLPATRGSRGAAERRPDVLALREQAKAARESADEPRYRLAPSVDLLGQVRMAPDPAPGTSWHEESVTLSLSWTIFDGGRYADRRSRSAQAEQIEQRERLLVRSIDAEVQAQLVTVRAARDASRIAEEAVRAARANTEETSILYQNGLARAIELVNANTEQFQAEVDAETARIEVVRGWLGLRFALGLPLLDDAGSEERRSP